MVKYNKAVSFIIIGMLILEIFIFYLLMTGAYKSPLCLEPTLL